MPTDTPVKQPDAMWNRFNPLEKNPAISGLMLMILASSVLIWANFNKPFYKFDDVTHLKIATQDSVADLFDISRKETLMPLSFLSLRTERLFFGPPFSETLFLPEGQMSVPIQEDFLERTVAWAAATRIANALYHALAGWILWLFLRRIGTSPGAAWVAAFAWTVHPMACESVCWISERKNVLAALFGFGSMYAWASLRESRWRWPAVSLLYLLSVMSKPTAVGFLPVYAALEILDPAGKGFSLRSRKNWVRLLTGLSVQLAITLVVIVVNLKIHTIVFVEHPGGSKWTALLTDLEIFARYMDNVLIPSNLSFFYGIKPIVELTDPRVWYYGAAIVCGCALGIWAPVDGASKKRSLLGLVWFFAALGPTSNLAPIPFWMQDRYAYVSAAGLLLSVVETARGLALRFNAARFAPIAGVGFVSLLAVMSLLRSMVYQNAESLYADAAARQPFSGMAQSCMFNQHLLNARRAREADVRREECQMLCYYLQQSSKCPDLTNFRNEFEMHVSAAHVLRATGDFEGVLKTLDGWVPPAHMSPLPPRSEHEVVARDLKLYYNPGRMAFAHSLMAESLMVCAETFPPAGKPGAAAITYADRIKMCDSALKFLHPSVDVVGPHPSNLEFNWDAARIMLEARILFARSRLKMANSDHDDRDGAMNDFNAAKEVLMNNLKDETVGTQAKALLESAKPPIPK